MIREALRLVAQALESGARAPEGEAAVDAFAAAGRARLGGVEIAGEPALAHAALCESALRGLVRTAAELEAKVAEARQAERAGDPARAARLAVEIVNGRHRAELARGALARCAAPGALGALSDLGARLRRLDQDLRGDGPLLTDAAAASAELRRDLERDLGRVQSDRDLRARFWWAFTEPAALSGRDDAAAPTLPRMAAAVAGRAALQLETSDGVLLEVTWSRGEPLAIELSRVPPDGARIELLRAGRPLGAAAVTGPFVTIAPAVALDGLEGLTLRLVHADGREEELTP